MILQSASTNRISDTLVFAPTFHARQSIGPLRDGLLRLPERVGVLIVDDDSCDRSAEYLTARAATEAHLRLMMRRRVGSQARMVAGPANCYSRLVTLDA